MDKATEVGPGSLCPGEAWNGYGSAQEKNLKTVDS